MEDKAAWCMFFASVAGFQFHPGNKNETVDLDYCAAVADAMFKAFKAREGVLWPH